LNTGPGAIGITSFSTSALPSSLRIDNETSASFIQKIGTSATYDGFTVNGPHYLIQGAKIEASIDDYSSLPLVIRGSMIVVKSDAYWGIMGRAAAAPVYVLYSDISGLPGVSSGDLVWLNSSNSVAFRNHIHGISNHGLQVGGGAYNVQVLENLIDHWTPAPGSHNDGIVMDGTARNVTIGRNKILLNVPETGAINVGGWVGKTTSLIMDSNYIAGGGYTLYGPGAAGNSFTNNVFGFDQYPNVGRWGLVYPGSWASSDPWINNRTADGKSVSYTGAVSAVEAPILRSEVCGQPLDPAQRH
jgi:hypothetical protein